MKTQDSFFLLLVKFLNIASLIFIICVFPNYKLNHYQYIASTVFFTSFFLEIFIEKRWKIFKWSNEKYFFISLIFFFLLQFFYYPVEQNLIFFHKIFEQRLPFLGFGIVGLFGLNNLYKLRYFAYAFILTSVFYILYIINAIGFNEFIYSSDKQLLFEKFRIDMVNTHMIFNSFLNTALIFVYYLVFFEKHCPFKRLIKPLAFFFGLLIYYVLFISEGRVGFIVANCLIFMMFLYKLWLWRKKVAILFLFFGGVGLAFLISNHSRMNMNKVERDPRKLIWKEAIALIKEKPVVGYGASTGSIKFIDKCLSDSAFIKQNDFQLLFEMRNKTILGANPHNVFFKTLIEYGIIGIIVLLTMFIFPILFVNRYFCCFIFMYVFSVVVQLNFDVFVTGIHPMMFSLISTVFTLEGRKMRDAKLIV